MPTFNRLVGTNTSGDLPDVVTAGLDARYVARLSAGQKMRELAAATFGRSSLDLPVIASPPTITFADSIGGITTTGLTKTWWWTTTPDVYVYRGSATPVVFSTNYLRFPTVTLPSGTGNVDSTHDGIGHAVEFIADAPAFYMEIVGRSGTNAGLRIEVDGVRYGGSTTFVTASTAPKFIRVDHGTRQLRHYRIEGDKGISWRGIATAPADTVFAPTTDNDITAALVADSLGAQQGITSPAGMGGFAYQIAKRLGWANMRSVSLGGTGFVATGSYASTFGDATRVADVVAADPDIVIIPASINDSGTADATLTAAALAAFQAYRTALPNVPIVAGGLFPGATGPSAANLAAEAAVKAAFDSWADDNSWWIPVTTDTRGSWVAGTGYEGATNGSGNSDAMVSTDATHPNDDGHAMIARRWAEEIRTTVLPGIA